MYKNKSSKFFSYLIKLFSIVFILFLLVYLIFSRVDKSSAQAPQISQFSPTDVFSISTEYRDHNDIQFSITIKPGFYIYKDTFKIMVDNIQQINLSQIKLPDTLSIPQLDDNTKTDQVFTSSFKFLVPINKLGSQFTISLQGCDGKTICYPLKTFKFKTSSLKDNTNINKVEPLQSLGFMKNFINFYKGDISSSAILQQFNFLQLLIIFFLAGLAISLTPCMYPLYPIALSSILGSSKSKKISYNLLLILTYVHGLTLIYVIMGFGAAYTGKMFTNFIQTAPVILVSSLIWFLLGLSMLDLFSIEIPRKIQQIMYNKSSKSHNGSFIKVFLLGIFSSIILGPCVTPPLIAAIGFIAGKGNLILGAISLYCLSIGMTFPLIILALFGEEFLPKSGRWMSWVKHLIGIILIIFSVYLAYPSMHLPNKFINIAMSCFIAGVLILIFNKNKKNIFYKYLPIFIIFSGIFFNYYGLLQLTSSDQQMGIKIKNEKIVTTISELDDIIKKSDRLIVVDIYASWCAICKEMDVKTFSNSSLQSVLKNFTFVKLDISNFSKQHQIILNQFNIFGPPAILIMDNNKKIKDKLLGFTSYEDLISKLK